MKILFTICGRAGSKGIKNKNIKDFLGKSLPLYTLSAIDLYLKSHPECEYDIAINTDSEELISIMVNSGMRTVEVIKRIPELCGDTVGKIDVIRNSMEIMEDRKKVVYDIIVDLDITSPLRREKDIENLIETHTKTNADLTTSVVLARRNPYFNQLKRGKNGFEKVCGANYTARQQAPEIYDMNASLYAYSPNHLRSGRSVLDGKIETIEMYDTGVLDLDHENDMELMKVIAKYLFENNSEFREVFINF